ncbi:hypothetical protein ALC53_00221 [Atta colombica]|uniref:Uncharacterized protein n=1 Tax=Atta colombica TaxID=520822 RepID=A0A195BYA4_9HYME|nr:hypothetical protein ALC53_00221 [Atta colombica]
MTSRCRAGGGENLSEELGTEDEGTNGNNFEPLSDSCGESDMEGLDLSLFEPQVDTASWCDSRIHAGTLHILVHYCEPFIKDKSKRQKQFPSHLTSNYSACDRNRGWKAIELTDCRILYVHKNIMLTNLIKLFHASYTLHHTQLLCRLTQRTHRLFRIQGRVEQWCGIDQPPKSGKAFCRSLNPNRHRNRWSSGLNRLSQYRRSIVHCAPYTCRRPRDET